MNEKYIRGIYIVTLHVCDIYKTKHIKRQNNISIDEEKEKIMIRKRLIIRRIMIKGKQSKFSKNRKIITYEVLAVVL